MHEYAHCTNCVYGYINENDEEDIVLKNKTSTYKLKEINNSDTQNKWYTSTLSIIKQTEYDGIHLNEQGVIIVFQWRGFKATHK